MAGDPRESELPLRAASSPGWVAVLGPSHRLAGPAAMVAQTAVRPFPKARRVYTTQLWSGVKAAQWIDEQLETKGNAGRTERDEELKLDDSEQSQERHP